MPVTNDSEMQVEATLGPPSNTAWPNGASVKIARTFSFHARYDVQRGANSKKPPYDYRKKLTTVSYTEFRGAGHPNDEFGAVGDIYLDITPHRHELYAKYPSQWEKRPGPGFKKTSLAHPEYANCFLWYSLEEGNVGWYSRNKGDTISMGEPPFNIPHTLVRTTLTFIRV